MKDWIRHTLIIYISINDLYNSSILQISQLTISQNSILNSALFAILDDD